MNRKSPEFFGDIQPKYSLKLDQCLAFNLDAYHLDRFHFPIDKPRVNHDAPVALRMGVEAIRALRVAGIEEGVYVEVLPTHTLESAQESADKLNAATRLRLPETKYEHTGTELFDERWDRAPVIISKSLNGRQLAQNLSPFWEKFRELS